VFRSPAHASGSDLKVPEIVAIGREKGSIAAISWDGCNGNLKYKQDRPAVNTSFRYRTQSTYPSSLSS
jgi:hypothetical protein